MKGINVLIPLGGLHSRFSNNGYLLPAPLVRIFGREIILWTLSNIRLTAEDDLMIVYNPQFLDKHILEGIVKKLHPRAHFAEIKFGYLSSTSRGPIDTILMGLRQLPVGKRNRPTICMDGDGHFTMDVTSLYRPIAELGEGAILSYNDVSPKPLYSYVEFSGPNRHVTKIREKEKISDWANTGTYCFPNGVHLQTWIEKLLRETPNDEKGGQYALYSSNVISMMMEKDKKKFRMIECKGGQFYSLGSPELIKHFAKEQREKGLRARKRFCFDLENTLVTAPKVPGDYSTCEPIMTNVNFVRSLSDMGHAIIVQSTVEAVHGRRGNVFHEVVQMLEDLRIPHDEVHFGKPKADFYIDDEAIYSGHDLSKELGFYDFSELDLQKNGGKDPRSYDLKTRASTSGLGSPAADSSLKKKVALAQHMRKCTMGDEDVYMNSHTGLPIFRVVKISTFFLFDLDGTMVATDPVYLSVFKEILSPFGHKVDKKFFEDNIHGRVDQEIFKGLLPSHLSQAEVKKIITRKDMLFRKTIFSNELGLLKPMSGLMDFLTWAEKNGIRSACVTNCPRNTAEALLTALDLRRRMDFLIIGAECTRAKPHPDPYEAAMARLGARPDECIVFEDSRSGVRSAVASKARMVIGIRSSLSEHVLMQHGANATVKDFTEIDSSFFSQIHSSHLSPKVEEDVVAALRARGFPVKGVSSARQLPGGNIAQCLRITMKYTTMAEDIPFPKTMILKMEYKDSSNGMVDALRLYSREWQFYKKCSLQVASRVPRAYALVEDAKKRTFGVIMEDLDEIESSEIKSTLTIEEAKAVTLELARMHAQFWNRTPDGILKANDPSLRGLAKALPARWEIFKREWKNQLLEEDIGAGEIIMHHLGWIQDQLSLPPYTLCHGDVTKRNIFFMRVMSSVSTPAFLDWQQTSAAKGISDLAHFILTSFPIDKQPAMEHQLVEVYHRALRMNGIYGYSLKQCWLDYRMSLMAMPFVMSIWYGSLNRSELVNPEFPSHMVTSSFNALRRHHAVALLPEYFSMALTQRCKKALRAQGYPVENVIVDAKKLKGGYICETLRLTIQYEAGVDPGRDPSKFPTSCVMKAEAPESSDHQTAVDLHLYDREWHFYQVMSPLVPVRCPKFYAAVPHTEGKGGVMGVLMEDLCIPGAILCPKLDYNGIKLLVDNAAKLHAKFWNNDKLEELGVHPLNGKWFQPSWEKKIAGHWPHFKAKWSSVLPPKSIMAGEKIVKNFSFVQNHLASKPFTFLHGDVKPANMFMLKDNIPAFIDWQYTKIGKGVCDIVFFLIEGYPETTQRELEGKVRKYYHKCLLNHGVTGYSLKDCERDWAIACMYFPIYVAMWFGTVPDELLVDEMFPRRFVPRAFDAIARNNSVSYIPEEK